MAPAATQIAPSLLSRAFADAANSGTLGGAAVLQNLARIAFDCIGASTAEGQLVAYVVYKVLTTFAENLEESKAEWDEVQRFVRTIHQPLADAIDYLSKPAAGRGSYTKAVSALIGIEVELLARPAAR